MLFRSEVISIWEWNRKHTLIYSFLMGALIDEPAAYAKVIDCTTTYNVWTTLSKEYGQSSNVMLRVLESQLTMLYKNEDTTMADHVDKYSQLIEQINYHLKPAEKWSNELTNCTFSVPSTARNGEHMKMGLAKLLTTCFLLSCTLKSRIAIRVGLRAGRAGFGPLIDPTRKCIGRSQQSCEIRPISRYNACPAHLRQLSGAI